MEKVEEGRTWSKAAEVDIESCGESERPRERVEEKGKACRRARCGVRIRVHHAVPPRKQNKAKKEKEKKKKKNDEMMRGGRQRDETT